MTTPETSAASDIVNAAAASQGPDLLTIAIWIGAGVLGVWLLAIIFYYVKGLWGSPRELYMLYLAKIFEYGAYGAINMTFILYLHEDCGLPDVAAGTYIAWFSITITISSILVGMVCDAIGIKKTLLLGTCIILASRICLPFFSNVYIVTFTSFLPMAVGMGILLPVLSVGIKYYTTTAGAALGFALFYTLMNVGWALGAYIFDAVRAIFGEHEIINVAGSGFEMSTYQIIFVAGFLLTVPQFLIFIMFRRGTRMTDDKGVVIDPPAKAVDAEGVPLTIPRVVVKAVNDTVGIFLQVITKKPFWIFIFMMAMLVPVRLVFYHFHYTWPTYGIRFFGDGAKVGNIYGVLNPMLIVFIAGPVAVLTRNIRSYTMLAVGTVISVGAVGIAIAPADWLAPLTDTWVGELIFERWLHVPEGERVPLYLSLILFVIVFTIGESIWSPRLMQFTAEIAPGGREGTYIAMSYIPYFAAKMIAGPMSGMLLRDYTPDDLPPGVEHHSSHHMTWVWIGGMAAITPIILITMVKLFRHAEQQNIEAATTTSIEPDKPDEPDESEGPEEPEEVEALENGDPDWRRDEPPEPGHD
ncbi:MAG: MFS transporter [Phycisphaerales bacterium]|nr:MAG: MFS transporter [Phycisphaerales bacterium]